jgi:hypothetical protein
VRRGGQFGPTPWVWRLLGTLGAAAIFAVALGCTPAVPSVTPESPTPWTASRTWPPTAKAPPAREWPVGFVPTEDDNVRFRWLDAAEYDCVDGAACRGIMVVTRDGCPSDLYGEISLLDDAGTVVGYSNDSVGTVEPRQQAKLVFEIRNAAARQPVLAKIDCY